MPKPIEPEKSLPTLDGVGITPVGEVDPSPAESSEVLTAPPNSSDDGTVAGGVQTLFVRIYALISAALLISAAVASQVKLPEQTQNLSLQAGPQVLFLVELLLVAVLTRYVPKLPRELSFVLLLVASVFNGVSFTFFFVWIPPAAIAYGFLLCGLAFGITAAVARWRNIDLSESAGVVLLFLSGLVTVAAITSAFRLGVFYWGTSYTGFMLFAALAWYYCDDLRDLDLEFDDDLTGWKSAVCGALVLYLNFVNLYLVTMRLLAQFASSTSARNRDDL